MAKLIWRNAILFTMMNVSSKAAAQGLGKLMRI